MSQPRMKQIEQRLDVLESLPSIRHELRMHKAEREIARQKAAHRERLAAEREAAAPRRQELLAEFADQCLVFRREVGRYVPKWEAKKAFGEWAVDRKLPEAEIAGDDELYRAIAERAGLGEEIRRCGAHGARHECFIGVSLALAEGERDEHERPSEPTAEEVAAHAARFPIATQPPASMRPVETPRPA